MLRILVFDEPFSVKLRLEGELTGQTAPQLTQRWAEVRSRLKDRKAILDLGDVVKVDDAGRDMLAWLFDAGVRVSYAHPGLQSLIEGLRRRTNASRIQFMKRLLAIAGRQPAAFLHRAVRFLCGMLPSGFRPCGCRSN